MINKNYEIIISKTMILDYTQTPREAKLITLKSDDGIIFDKIMPFKAHRRLYKMGLQHLINW